MLDTTSKACTARVTWHIQKNHQNGQSLTLAADVEHPEICPVCSALHIAMRAQRLLFDIVALGRYIGPRLSKYAQTTQDKFDYHTNLLGHQVIKAFIGKDYVFYNSKKRVLTDLMSDTIDKACTVKITWRIQKNC